MNDIQKVLKIDKRSGYYTTDVVRLFLLIRTRPMGRTALIRGLKLGEATVKTMIKNLKAKGFVSQGTRGVYPTGKAESLFSFCSSITGPKKIDTKENRKSVVLAIRNASSKVRSGIEQRDEGVRFGASIMTMVMDGGNLILAGVPGHAPPYKKEIEESFDMEDGDVSILSGADSELAAERGAISASIVTLG